MLTVIYRFQERLSFFCSMHCIAALLRPQLYEVPILPELNIVSCATRNYRLELCLVEKLDQVMGRVKCV
jgi:hypothetical protein